jgi:hypothetical protein
MGRVEYVGHAAGPGPMMPCRLGACGYLRAVLVELLDHEEMPGGAAKAEVVAVLHEGEPHEALPILATARPPEYPAWRGERFALWLAEPVPNLNSARGYTVTLETDMAVTVRLSQVYHRQVFR